MTRQKDNYNPFKTALTRTSLSAPTRHLFQSNLLNGKILDYGCGKGSDVAILKEMGYNAAGYDKFNPKYKNNELLKDHYDIAICNYVFNVIHSLEEHKEVLNILERIADKVYIAVRTDVKAIQDNWIYDKDNLGYWTPKGTYQRFYSDGLIKKLFNNQAEVIKVGNGYKLLKIE